MWVQVRASLTLHETDCLPQRLEGAVAGAALVSWPPSFAVLCLGVAALSSTFTGSPLSGTQEEAVSPETSSELPSVPVIGRPGGAFCWQLEHWQCFPAWVKPWVPSPPMRNWNAKQRPLGLACGQALVLPIPSCVHGFLTGESSHMGTS